MTPHLAKPVAPGSVTLPTDKFVEPSDIDFYLWGRLEGTAAPASGTRPSERGIRDENQTHRRAAPRWPLQPARPSGAAAVEADFGNSVRSVIEAQTANPATLTSPSTATVTGVDPDYAQQRRRRRCARTSSKPEEVKRADRRWCWWLDSNWEGDHERDSAAATRDRRRARGGGAAGRAGDGRASRIDTGHLVLNKSRLQSTVDAAALAAAKVLDQTDSEAQATAAAHSVFDLNAAKSSANCHVERRGHHGPVSRNTLSPFAPGTTPPNYVRVRAENFSMWTSFTRLLGFDEMTTAPAPWRVRARRSSVQAATSSQWSCART